MKKFTLAAVLLAGTALATPASADAVSFYTGGVGYNGPFNGSGTVYAQTNTLGLSCPTGSTCSGSDPDVRQNTENFATTANSSVTIQATASQGVNAINVWGDFGPNFGGLGAGNADPDNLSGTELLTLTFGKGVILTGVATLYDPAHKDDCSSPCATTFGGVLLSDIDVNDHFRISVDGGAFQNISFGDANNVGLGSLSLQGTTFIFAEGLGSGDPSLYVSGLTYHSVPGPIVGAGLPGLILAVLGMFGLGRRRRRD